MRERAKSWSLINNWPQTVMDHCSELAKIIRYTLDSFLIIVQFDSYEKIIDQSWHVQDCKVRQTEFLGTARLGCQLVSGFENLENHIASDRSGPLGSCHVPAF